MTALEKLAREHDGLLANYDRLLRLLADVAAGRTPPSCVTVDLQTREYDWDLSRAAAARPPFGPAMEAAEIEQRIRAAEIQRGSMSLEEAAAFSERFRAAEQRIRRGSRREDIDITGTPDVGTLDDLKRAVADHEANGD